MDFKDVITGRRSVNFFDPQKPVSDDLLKEMVELAALAPSSFNLQPWSLVVVKDAERKKSLQKLAWDQPKVSEAPVILVVLADRSAWRPGHPVLEHNFEEMVAYGRLTADQRQWFEEACMSLYGESIEKQQAFAVKNTAFFAMALMLAAKHLGLDTHPMDGFDHQAVRKLFNVPDQYWIPLLLAVGYFKSDEKLLPPKWRKSFEQIVVEF